MKDTIDGVSLVIGTPCTVFIVIFLMRQLYARGTKPRVIINSIISWTRYPVIVIYALNTFLRVLSISLDTSSTPTYKFFSSNVFVVADVFWTWWLIKWEDDDPDRFKKTVAKIKARLSVLVPSPQGT